MIESDLSATLVVRKIALEWLDRTQGREPQPWRPTFPAAMAHILRTDPDGCWVAEMDGILVGYAQALQRGDIWFLSQLFVLPDVHSLGVGEQLLARSQEYGRARKARVFSVVASASLVAQSLYMRHGMFARGVAYRMSGPIAPLLELPEPSGNRKKIVDCSGWQDRMAELDRLVFGAERRQDHAFYLSGELSSGEERSFGLNRDGNLAGYAYASEQNGGMIAPIAAYEAEDQLPLLRMAAEWLHGRGAETGSMWVISLNETIMSALLAAKWRVQWSSFFLTSAPFGQFDRYQPSGGILL